MSDVILKACLVCKQELPNTLEFFYARSKTTQERLCDVCKKCSSERNKAWYQANKEKVKSRVRDAYRKDPEKHRQADRDWYENNKERASKSSKDYRLAHVEACNLRVKNWIAEHKQQYRETYNNWLRRKLKTDPQYARKFALHRSLKFVLLRKKQNAYVPLVGCTVTELRQHIESLFQSNMTWENKKNRVWEVDHIRPCCSFDLTDPKQAMECFHYTNLQPLTRLENLKKGKTYEQTK